MKNKKNVSAIKQYLQVNEALSSNRLVAIIDNPGS